MDKNQNVSLIKRLFKEGFTQGKNPAVFDEVISKDVITYDLSNPNFPPGIEAFKRFENNYLRAFPDKVVRIDDIFAAEDRVVVCWTCTGTHHGDLPNIPATGNPIKCSGVTIFQFAAGKAANIWHSWDRLGLLEQIGQRELTGKLE
ncbi:MAG: ester cyclase [Waddliaceae bacterium]